MKKVIAVVLALAALTWAQTSSVKSDSTQTKATTAESKTSGAPEAKANPDDVKSVDAIMAALYDVISGPAGPRNWDRFRSLFASKATLAAIYKDKQGQLHSIVMTPEDYVTHDAPYFEKNAFFEHEVARKSESFGNIAHAFSTYASTKTKGGEPFERGINSIELYQDAGRWWVLTILWDSEREGNSIPAQYLKNSQ